MPVASAGVLKIPDDESPFLFFKKDGVIMRHLLRKQKKKESTIKVKGWNVK
jgi:hypothetical protein